MSIASIADLLMRCIDQQREQAALLYALNEKLVPRPEGARPAASPGTETVGKPANLAALATVARQAEEAIDKEAAAQERLLASAAAHLGILDRTDSAVRRLAQGMGQLIKKQPSLKKAFEGLERSLGVAMAANAAFDAQLRSFAHAASPGLFRAMEQSVTLLQARIGGALLPVMDSSIDTIMDVADWFAGLSDGAKKLVAGGAIALPLAIGLGSALRALAPALALATAGVKKLSASASSASPAMVGGGAAVTAVMAGVAVWQMAEADNERQAQRLREQHEASGPVSEEELRRARGESRRMGYGDSISDEDFAKMGEEERKRYFQERAAFLRQRAEVMRGRAMEGNPLNILRGRYATQGEIQQRESAAMIFERAAKEGAETLGEAGMRKQIRRQSMRVSAIQQENQPHYSPLAEARKQLQLQILGKNRYEQEILREQRKHRTEEIKRLDKLIEEFRQRFPKASLFS